MAVGKNRMDQEASARDSQTSVWINLPALEENYRLVCGIVGTGATVLCVIKADAYGHGAVEAGRRLEVAGAGYFGVATLEEGKELRKSGISTPILILSGVMPWETPDPLAGYELTSAVTNWEMLEKIAEYGSRTALKIHVKIDTGMGRLGFGMEDVHPLIKKLQKLKHVEVEGIMSHFASSEKHDDYGREQVRNFRQAVDLFKQGGIEPKFVHMANSGAICNYPEAHFSMVRVGIMLYGSFPDTALCGKIALRPVMRVSSRISAVRLFPAGFSLSYGRSYVTGRKTKVGYVPLGYADGYPRALSNRAPVVIKGRRCSIIGRICMDWLLVDITEIPDVHPGEEVVLLGTAEGGETITADEIAELAGTIPYEVLCGMGTRRVLRRYV
jgi:alanine racemase